MNKKYAQGVREKAIATVEERRLRNPRDRTIFREVAEAFKVGEQSLRLWVRASDEARLKAEGPVPSAYESGGATVENMAAELEALRRKIQKLQAQNDVLKRAFVVLSSEWGK